MRILHLSDLHRGAAETLRALWSGPQSALRRLPTAEQRFDFIILSGDLSESAQPEEYDELLEFITTTLVGYLREPEDRRRLIVVPGNHDVDWSAELGHPLEFAALLDRPGGAEEVERALRRYREDPARSGIRQRISRYGHVDWLRLEEAKQANRFRNVQRFLDQLYGDALADPSRGFELTDPREGHDWSAHIFPEEQVAFAGFNSCFLNDRYWVGAAISRQSIANATHHLHEHAEGCLRIAVWHHGVHTDSYRPDYLNQADIGELIISGFQVGFHGHTHKASAEQLDWLTDRFVIVSTGSVGANQHHRPDAVGRQFSIARLYPHQAYIQVYERGGDTSAYLCKRSRTFSLLSPDDQDPREASAEHHRRSYRIRPSGAVTVKVELTGFQSPRPVLLAELAPPVVEMLETIEAIPAIPAPARSPGLEIRRSAVNGLVRFTLYPLEYRPSALTWSYVAANALPLHQAEAPYYSDDRHHRRSPDPQRSGSIIQTHPVAFSSNHLELECTFDDPAIIPSAALPQVERLTEGPGDRFWERVPAEEERCELVFDGPVLRLRVEAPIVGYRYGFALTPRDPGRPLAYTPTRIASKLLEECLDARDNPHFFATLLHATVEAAIASVFEVESLDGLTWRGLLWDPARQRLSTAFGAFPNRQWAVSFAYGAGVPGQAFRFNRVAASCQPPPGQRHQPSPLSQCWHREWGELEHDDWAVGIPIVGDPERQHAIGVVCFEGPSKTAGFGGRLREFANAALFRQTSGTPWEGFIDDLSTAVNTGFWQACAGADGLGDYRGFIHTLVSRLGLGRLTND